MRALLSKSAITKVQVVILAVVVVVALITGVAYYYLSLPKEVYIKIGYPLTVTGGLAGFAEGSDWVIKKVEDYVNNKMGGIYISEYGRKLPIKIILRDTKSDPDFAATVAADLITKEGVHIMAGGSSPPGINPIAEQCEKYGVPAVVTCIPLAFIPGPYNWVYYYWFSEIDCAFIYVGMWDQVETNKVFAGLGSDDPDGRTFKELTIAVAEARGYRCVSYDLVPYGTADFSSYIQKWKSAGVEILTGNIFPPDGAALWRQCREMGFIPKVATIARAFLFESSVEALGGDLGVGITTEAWTSKAFPFKSSLLGQTLAEFYEEYEKLYGRHYPIYSYCSESHFEVVIDALKRAASLDKYKIRDAIANTDLDTLAGHICFKKPLSEILSAEEMPLYERYAQNLLKYQDHFSFIPVVGGQWVKGSKWPYELAIVYNWKYDYIPETAPLKTIPELLASP
jgi:branched-chain amino acid transport system substrate-binding protein